MSRKISLFDVGPILGLLDRGEFFVTPNQRLASRISTAYAIHHNQTNRIEVIESPNVNSLQGWIDRCWRNLLYTAFSPALKLTVLSSNHEQVIWERIVAESSLGQALLRPSATAAQAASAYRSLIEWDQDLSSHALKAQFNEGEDSAVFLSWVNRFELMCREQSWITGAQRVQIIIDAFDSGYLESPGTIYGVAFESIAPLYTRLLNSVGEFHHVDTAPTNALVNVVACDTVKMELAAAGIWAKKILQSDKAARVAIVLPDLVQQRHDVQRVLQEIFEPDFNKVSAPSVLADNVVQYIEPRRNLPFNLSAGYPLSEAPVICAALDILSLQVADQEVETLETIIQSPFYGFECETDTITDFHFRGQLISLLRMEKTASITFARFRQLAIKIADKNQGNSTRWYFPDLLQNQANLLRDSEKSTLRPLTDWVLVIQSQLKEIGWPGNRVLDSIEYQQVSQWQSVMAELSDLEVVLDPVDRRLSLSQTLAHLRTILSNKIFQPQTIDSPLQVLGTLEAAGLRFSHLWIASMSERQWPSAPAPNPLIPTLLQRETLMPHACPERELLFAKNLTERFINSAEHVVVSFPESQGDNPEKVSALFGKYPQKTIRELLGRPLEDLLPKFELRERHFDSSCLETVTLKNAPKLGLDERVRGGSRVFASQSACPFRAFATHRLGIKALEQPELGLSAADRGSLLHRALEFIWEKLKDQQGLLALNDSNLAAMCFESSANAVTELALRLSFNRLGKRFQELEAKRLTKLLLAWLSVEKERAEFTVESLEQRKKFRFRQLELETRIDRIDRLADGSFLVIDYKTGAANVNRWWGDRPDEPQLPLYSMLAEADDNDEVVGGIAFAKIRPEDCSLTGAGDPELPEQRVRWTGKIQTESGAIDWQHLKEQWTKILTALAEDFISGRADIDPSKPPKTCQYCELAPVCRVNHKELAK